MIQNLENINNYIQSLNIKSPATQKLQENPYDYTNNFQPNTDYLEKRNLESLDQLKDNLKQNLYEVTPELARQMNTLNQKRIKDGKEPVVYDKIVKEIETIYNKSYFSEDEKRKELGDLRKKYHLSKNEMKSIFTNRLADLYKEAGKKVGSLKKQHLDQIQKQTLRSQNTFGPQSPQGQEWKKLQSKIEKDWNKAEEDFDHKAKSYKKTSPSFWDKLKSAFSSISKAFQGIPILGSIFRNMERMINIGKSLFTGKIGNMFKNIGNMIADASRDFGAVAPFIPGIGPIASMAAKVADPIIQKLRTQESS